MRIHALLPAKEIYSAAHAGAVAMVVQDFLAHSAYQKEAIVIGANLNEPPLKGAYYQSIKSWHRYVYGQNKGLAYGYISWVKSLPADKRPEIIEVHGRCAVAGLVARALPEIPVMLVLHNDPRVMDGAKSVLERKALVKCLAGIAAVSEYLIACFQEGLGADDVSEPRFYLTKFGMDSLFDTPPQKQKTILLVGRMVPEKGILQAAEAAAQCLPRFPDWTLKIIGARRFKNGTPTAYQKQVDAALSPLGRQAEILGHLPLSDVRHHQAEAAIILAPSQWEEPAGRVILEALAAGAALISAHKGGIPEYAGKSAILLDEPNAEQIAQSLMTLIDDTKKREYWQKRAWQHKGTSLLEAAQTMDAARQAIVSHFVKPT